MFYVCKDKKKFDTLQIFQRLFCNYYNKIFSVKCRCGIGRPQGPPLRSDDCRHVSANCPPRVSQLFVTCQPIVRHVPANCSSRVSRCDSIEIALRYDCNRIEISVKRDCDYGGIANKQNISSCTVELPSLLIVDSASESTCQPEKLNHKIGAAREGRPYNIMCRLIILLYIA